MKRMAKHPAAQALLAALVGRYLAFALRTTRWTVHGSGHLAGPLAGRVCIAAFWHERLPMMPALWLHVRRATAGRPRAHVLVSRHRDGRFIGAIMRRFVLGVLHGSSLRGGRDRGGATAQRAMLAALAAGEHVVITPDGPRGPRRVAAPGVAQLAMLSGCPVLPCAAQTTRRRVIRSWDRMVLPLPFGRGVLVVGVPIAVASGGAEMALPLIAAAMTAACDAADRLCA